MSAILPPHPLDHGNVVKILLGQAASDALAALGDHCLIVTARADSTAPQAAQGRIVLHCLPITKELADQAHLVASGSHRAVKAKKG